MIDKGSEAAQCGPTADERPETDNRFALTAEDRTEIEARLGRLSIEIVLEPEAVDDDPEGLDSGKTLEEADDEDVREAIEEAE